MLDDIPIRNPERDKAWEAWIKRKDVKALMKGKEDSSPIPFIMISPS